MAVQRQRGRCALERSDAQPGGDGEGQWHQPLRLSKARVHRGAQDRQKPRQAADMERRPCLGAGHHCGARQIDADVDGGALTDRDRRACPAEYDADVRRREIDCRAGDRQWHELDRRLRMRTPLAPLKDATPAMNHVGANATVQGNARNLRSRHGADGEDRRLQCRGWVLRVRPLASCMISACS
jgi:hypothetical protein